MRVHRGGQVDKVDACPPPPVSRSAQVNVNVLFVYICRGVLGADFLATRGGGQMSTCPPRSCPPRWTLFCPPSIIRFYNNPVPLPRHPVGGHRESDRPSRRSPGPGGRVVS